MFKFVSAALTAAFLAVPASAAVIDMPVGSADYFAFENTGDLVVSGDAVIDELDGAYLADFSLTYDLADPLGTATGAFNLFDGADTVVSGVLTKVGLAADELTMSFSDLTGLQAGLFGKTLSVNLAFFDALGDNVFAAFMDGTSYEVSAMVVGEESPAPVPLPAGLVLLGSGLGLLALKRRR